MNRRSSGSSDCQCTSSAASHPSRLLPLPLSKALNGFTITKQAEGLSPRTVNSYLDCLSKWVEHTGDRDISQVTGQQISSYLAWLRTDYQPHRFGGMVALLGWSTYDAVTKHTITIPFTILILGYFVSFSTHLYMRRKLSGGNRE